MSDENFHPTRRIVDQHGDAWDVDVEMAPLIEALWRLGVETCDSCQDVGGRLLANEQFMAKRPHLRRIYELEVGRASIGFCSYEDADVLLTAVLEYDHDELYDRVTHWATPNAWKWSVQPLMRAYFGPRLSFPASDIPEVLKRVTNLLADVEKSEAPDV